MAELHNEEVIANKLSDILSDNISTVLQKFLELYGKVYTDTIIIDAMTKSLVYLNQQNLTYLCGLCEEAEVQNDKEKLGFMRDHLHDFVKYLHEENLEIFNNTFEVSHEN